MFGKYKGKRLALITVDNIDNQEPFFDKNDSNDIDIEDIPEEVAIVL